MQIAKIQTFQSFYTVFINLNFNLSNIYIFIAFALVESVILNVLQFPMQNIYQSCDLGRTIRRSNVNVSQ